MWDLTVSDVHTFAVGDGQWVVHNACPHFANASVTDDAGEIIWSKTVKSGDMTDAEKALGYPLSAQATRTEIKALAAAPLAAGRQMTIVGYLPAYSVCKGAMNRASRQTGAQIDDVWPGGVWAPKR